MAAKNKDNQPNAMMKLATFIVDKRNLFFLVLVICLIFSAISWNWVTVENDLKAYLPDHSESRQGLDLMDEEFVTYGTAQVMVENVSRERAQSICDELEQIKGVQSIDYEEEDDYRNVSALYAITFDYSEKDDKCLDSLEAVKDALSDQE